MKRVFVTAAVLMAGLASGGCATTGGKSHTAVSVARYDSKVDYSKVVSVNRWATMHGYGIEWVNLPQKKVASKDD